MEAKDVALVIGVVVTLVLGVWNIINNHRTSKKTTFINSVTAERVKWIDKLRENIASFAGLIHHWVASGVEKKDPKKSDEIVKEIDRLRVLIKLQLNPDGEHDQKIIELINTIPNLTHHPDKGNLLRAEGELISYSQALLKEEWDKVKDEAQWGALADHPPLRVRAWRWCKSKCGWLETTQS